MKKRLIAIFLAITLIFGMSISSFATANPIEVALNGEGFILENLAYINEEGIVMVPIRQILEELNYQVKWSNEENSVTVLKESESVEFKIGETCVKANGKEFNISTSAILRDKSTFVPLELLSKAFDLVIGWDSKHQLLNISEPMVNIEEIFSISSEKEIKDSLNKYMEALEKNNNFYGSVLVAKGGNVLLSEGYGLADVSQDTLNMPQTTYAIGSVTKQFVAMAIMQLKEQGLLGLDDTISKYLPDFPNGEMITLHHLLTHSSGLVNFTELTEIFMESDHISSPEEILEFVKDEALLYNPGEEFSYCNTNYLILGLILEQLSGISYEEYLTENIFKPLGMINTGILYGENQEIQDATAYAGHLEIEPVDDEILLGIAYGAGNIYSTVEDLYRWEQALDKLVKNETLEEVFAGHMPMGDGTHYGYGWMIADSNLGKMIFHGGNTLGFTADITRLPDQDLTITILSNKGYVDFTNMKNNLISIALGGSYELPESKVVIEIEDTNIYDKYVGRYDLLIGQELDILKIDNKLYAQVTGQGSFEIYPESNTKFFAKLIDVEIEFVLDEDGNATDLIFKQGFLILNSPRIGDIEEKEEAEIDPAVYDKYIGEYELMPGALISITRDGDRIFAQLTGQDKAEIYPSSELEFFYKIVDATITFVLDDEGNVTSLVLEQMGQEMPALKIE